MRLIIFANLSMIVVVLTCLLIVLICVYQCGWRFPDLATAIIGAIPCAIMIFMGFAH